MIVRPAYKCLLCGQVSQYGEAQDIPREALPVLLGKAIAMQRFAGTSLRREPMYASHGCRDGNVGLAYFAGFQRAEL